MGSTSDPLLVASRMLEGARDACARGAIDEAVASVDEALVVLAEVPSAEHVVVADELADVVGAAAAIAIRAGALELGANIADRCPSELSSLATALRALSAGNALAAFVRLDLEVWPTDGARQAVRALSERVAEALDASEPLERQLAVLASGLGEDATAEGSDAAEARRDAWARARGWRRAQVAHGELVRRLLARRSLDPEHAGAYEDHVARSGWLVDDADADALAAAGALAEQKLETHGVLVLRTYFRWLLRSGREDEARATLERFVAARPQIARSVRRTFDHELRRSRNA